MLRYPLATHQAAVQRRLSIITHHHSVLHNRYTLAKKVDHTQLGFRV